MSFGMLLIHAPLVGPSSWQRFADVATRHGMRCEIPDLTGVARAVPPMWEHFVNEAADAGRMRDEPLVLIGHSGAGVFLPLIADRLNDRVVALAFVDAVVPPVTGGARPSPTMRQLVASKSVDGLLLPWMDWWPSELMAELVPDETDRALLRSDLPRLPASFYDEVVPMPTDWTKQHCAYLQLSEGYVEDRWEVERRGWPTESLDGTHLSILTDPERVFDSVLELVRPSG